jgi:hypothetical protein
MKPPMTSIERWRTAWGILMPHIAVPSETDAARWLRFPQVIVDRAILRCRHRYALNVITKDFEPAHAYRWVTLIASEDTKAERNRLMKKLQFGEPVTAPVTDTSEPDDNIGNRHETNVEEGDKKMTTKTLNQEQVNAAIRSWDVRIEAKPTAEEYERFKPLRDQWEKLNSIPEAQRTSWQVEAHAALFDELITNYWSPFFAWSKLNQSDKTFTAAAAHHLKQYQQ